jgi:collagenase-like PrtC family protease
MRTIELLAPAKNLDCAIAAIDHGADAVYIGASRFGARAAAGNTIDDIKKACDYAHQYLAKVYVTVNTIVYDDEIDDTCKLIHQLYDAGVDAILVQDMGILKMDLPPIALHASTQTDNRTPQKVEWLSRQGFSRAVLARELSTDEIANIHKAVPDIELEVFVHGALCVSYSGICYASQHCFNRSANRGECAQFCRLKFDLRDSDGVEIQHQRHLLSLKDMCQIDNLESLLIAGASSFKIEGRLKDVSYVKNVVAAYSERLNKIIENHPSEYRRSSLGRIEYTFTPNLHKTFNRGFTNYFIDGRQPDIASFDTPKAMGEYVGKVKEIRGNSFNVAGTSSFVNGDGLCFINDSHELEGFRVNRVENNRLFPFKMPTHLRPGLALYRNNDQEFERILNGETASRKIPVEFFFSVVPDGFQLQVSLKDDNLKCTYSVTENIPKVLAQKPQQQNIIRQLSKLGNTPYVCEAVNIEGDAGTYFIPSSQLAEMRRKVVESFSIYSHSDVAGRTIQTNQSPLSPPSEYKSFTYLYNVSNHLSRQFYAERGLNNIENAFELQPKSVSPLIMQCRHCLRYSLGYCVKHGGKKPQWHEPLFLELPDGRRFRLEFKCNECQMNVYAE